MKYLIYDMGTSCTELERLASDSVTVLNASQPAANCVGCFRCWLKVPGKCTFADSLQNIGSMLMTSDEIIIICESLYGGFSVNVKRLIDRVIPGVLPFFIKKNNELHHSKRYNASPSFKAIFYNAQDMSADEKQQAETMLSAVALNFHSKKHQVIFTDTKEQAFAEVTK